MEKRVIEPTNILLTFLIGVVAVLFVIGSIASFDLDFNNSVTISVVTSFVYAVIVFFLLRPKIVYEEPKTIEKIIEKPIIREIEKIIEKPVIREIEKQIEKPAIKKIIFEKTKEKIEENVKKQAKKSVAKYIGSKETEKFHKASCKFAKLIKGEYKILENNKKYFLLRGYKPCKTCNP
jgi:hypothetical protein